jgi:hypothetical protein
MRLTAPAGQGEVSRMSRFLPRAVVLATLTAATAVACSSSGDEPTALPSGPGLTTTAAAPTTTAPTPAAPSPQPSVGTRRSPIRWLGPAEAGSKAAVAETTRSYWSMVVRLAEKPDPDDPEIAQLSVDPQAGQLVTLFTDVKAQGLSQRGPIDGSVTVGSVGASTASATTCLDQTLTLLYDKAGTKRPGSNGTRSQFTVTLTNSGGAWKVSQVKSSGADCTLPR